MTSTTGYFVFYQPLGYQASSEFLESQKHAGAHVDHSGGLVWIFPVIHFTFGIRGIDRTKIYGCRYHFQAFQLELHNLGTENFEIDSVVKSYSGLKFAKSWGNRRNPSVGK